MTDKKDLLKKSVLISIILFIFSAGLSAQSYFIDYYGIVSTEIDENMSKMTSDLYYTQLTEINNFTITDKRTSPNLKNRPDISAFSENALSFFTLITKDSDSDKWITTYYVIDKANNEEHSKQKKFDSFYKILMEPKDVLRQTIKQLIENDTSAKTLTSQTSSEAPDLTPTDISSTEELSGTWTGEDNIRKIVIMRGGRGFVIFKNGATMNIIVELSDDESNKQVLITQKGHSNASFYPELQRSAALTAAVSAEPIKWTLTLINGNTLKGIKETLLPEGNSYKQGTVSVIWTRLN